MVVSSVTIWASRLLLIVLTLARAELKEAAVDAACAASDDTRLSIDAAKEANLATTAIELMMTDVPEGDEIVRFPD